MQLGLPFESTAPATPSLDVYFVRHRRARRYILRVDAEGRLRVTIPRGGSRRDAERFARSEREWVARQRARLPHPTLSPVTSPAARIEAVRELPLRLLELARLNDLRVSRVSVRDQRTRWGSCGRNGHICLSWRLMLMPEWVRDYVLVHELMHLRRLDHSPAFWACVEAAYPQWRSARRWLRVHGPSLRSSNRASTSRRPDPPVFASGWRTPVCRRRTRGDPPHGRVGLSQLKTRPNPVDRTP